MPFGTIKFFSEPKGYGFIGPDDGSHDVFVHITAVETAGMRRLIKDQRIGYDLEDCNHGRTSAVNLRPVEQYSPPVTPEPRVDADSVHTRKPGA